MGKYLVGGAVGLALGLATAAQAAAAEAPPARQGFQMAIRTGYAIPLGSAAGNVNTSGDLAMSDFVTGQVPVIFDIGGKIGPDFFLGGYFGLGFGGPAGMQSAECDALNASCTALSLHIGIEGQYHIMPGEPVNPWVGY